MKFNAASAGHGQQVIDSNRQFGQLLAASQELDFKLPSPAGGHPEGV